MPGGADEEQQAAAEKPAKQLVAVKKEKQEPADSDHKHAAAALKPRIQGQIMLAGGVAAVKHQAAAAAAGDGLSRHQQQPEVFIEPPDGGDWYRAGVQLSQVKGWQEMWRQLRTEFPHLLPDSEFVRFKVVYLDADGDWVKAPMHDMRWRSFCEAATKVLICTAS